MSETCFLHPSVEATTTCEDCRAALCATCTESTLGHSFCAACLSARLGTTSRMPPPSVEPPPRGGSAKLKLRWVAGLLSGLLPGLGNIYTGYVVRGIAQFAAWWLVFAAARGDAGSFFLGSILAVGTVALWVWGIVDAVQRAGAINQRGFLATPEEARSASLGPVNDAQLRFLGVGLVSIGVLLFGQQVGGPFLQLFRFALPITLIGSGAWVVHRARLKDEREQAGAFVVDEVGA